MKFRRIVLDVMTEALNADGGYDGIGRLGEKQMHAAIKRFICPDVSCHEIKIDGSEGCILKERDDDDGSHEKRKTRKFVADVLEDGTIYEIQTGSFARITPRSIWPIPILPTNSL